MSLPSSNTAELPIAILENLSEAIIAVDCSSRVLLFNPAAEALTGLSRRQAVGSPLQQIFAASPGILHLVTAVLTSGRSVTDRDSLLLERPPTPPVPASACATPLYDRNGRIEGVILSLRNAAYQRQLEQEIQRADRLAMLGTLAAGLAHEIRNPLGGIKGAAQLLSLELADRPQLLDYTAIMIKESNRVNQIIEELMRLTQPRPSRTAAVDINRLLAELVLLQKQSDAAAHLQFELQLDPSLPAIAGDPDLLPRLFLNLIKNAIEACTGGGHIRIRSCIDPDQHLVRPGESPCPFVLVQIQDSGCGIPPENLANIFTPFYTTKAQGTGLGLALCQKIVYDHDGLLQFDSVPDHGTCCSVYLPFRPLPAA